MPQESLSLWADEKATQKHVADRFRDNPGAFPSELVPVDDAERHVIEVHRSNERDSIDHSTRVSLAATQLSVSTDS